MRILLTMVLAFSLSGFASSSSSITKRKLPALYQIDVEFENAKMARCVIELETVQDALAPATYHRFLRFWEGAAAEQIAQTRNTQKGPKSSFFDSYKFDEKTLTITTSNSKHKLRLRFLEDDCEKLKNMGINARIKFGLWGTEEHHATIKKIGSKAPQHRGDPCCLQ